mmetsp:Transcript_47212/g.119523  ORF Transcript_47212/g.119523 Transcript_47212/m.119523 type:complete len:241 (-) Transcript_47212:1222-1944(-)
MRGLQSDRTGDMRAGAETTRDLDAVAVPSLAAAGAGSGLLPLQRRLPRPLRGRGNRCRLGEKMSARENSRWNLLASRGSAMVMVNPRLPERERPLLVPLLLPTTRPPMKRQRQQRWTEQRQHFAAKLRRLLLQLSRLAAPTMRIRALRLPMAGLASRGGLARRAPGLPGRRRGGALRPPRTVPPRAASHRPALRRTRRGRRGGPRTKRQRRRRRKGRRSRRRRKALRRCSTHGSCGGSSR